MTHGSVKKREICFRERKEVTHECVKKREICFRQRKDVFSEKGKEIETVMTEANSQSKFTSYQTSWANRTDEGKKWNGKQMGNKILPQNEESRELRNAKFINRDVNNSPPFYQCPLCEELNAFTSTEQVSEHVRIHHANEKGGDMRI